MKQTLISASSRINRPFRKGDHQTGRGRSKLLSAMIAVGMAVGLQSQAYAQSTDPAARAVAFSRACQAPGLGCAAPNAAGGPFDQEQSRTGPVAASVSNPLVGSASAYGFYDGSLALPTLKAGAFGIESTPANNWSYSSVSVLQRYVWTGPEADLPLTGRLDYELATVPGVSRASLDGQAGIFASLWIVDASFIGDPENPIKSFTDIFNVARAPFFGDPGTDYCSEQTGVLAFSSLGNYQTSGPANVQLGVSNGCDGNPFRVSQGQEFFVYASLTATATGGGAADALNTFRVDLADGVTAEQRALIAGSLQPAIAAVPEPETWAMMLLGFGFVGGAMRSAKRRQKLTVSYA